MQGHILDICFKPFVTMEVNLLYGGNETGGESFL